MVSLNKFYSVLDKTHVIYKGKVSKVVGTAIESIGPISNIGDICEIVPRAGRENILAEVVGFRGKNILLMPLGTSEGIGPGCSVISNGEKITVNVDETLLGKILDWRANPLDGTLNVSMNPVPIERAAPDPLKRKRISQQMILGIKAIDGMLSIGSGQRMGIFAGSGVGKSTLIGMIARNALSDVNVIALIGERGREVREFLEKDLKEEGLARSIVVVATSDQPALIRLKAAKTATAIAEYFRDQGKQVLFLMDSLTRFSMAQREIGLSIGEPPVSRGYTPSVFGIMPKLLERTGNNEVGGITGLYTVLVDGDDFNEPVTDTARGILDGHIMLSRKIAHKAHYPAIDILSSISRVMGDVVSSEHRELANIIKKHMATYAEVEDLINVGAYNRGSNPEIDAAIEKMPAINSFLTQKVDDNFSLDQTINIMRDIVR
ncbi:MAG: flagellar protein export ATPase FliI [Candidatus Epulonipiscioides saccharophilum]|nr:MAG: flagellar protein export ATPase FliI [Epulopiscium sp. AS2M-Bin001]